MSKQPRAHLKIRRTPHSRSLRDIPLDEVDMFLLSLLEDEIELSALTEIAPRNALECLRRVLRLGQLGLLHIRFDSSDERLLAEGCDEAAVRELLDNANTLRPPPPGQSYLGATDEKPTTGMRRRPEAAPSPPKPAGRRAG